MLALDWLIPHGHILRGAIQPIECILFAWLSVLLLLQCDSALNFAKTPLDNDILFNCRPSRLLFIHF